MELTDESVPSCEDCGDPVDPDCLHDEGGAILCCECHWWEEFSEDNRSR